MFEKWASCSETPSFVSLFNGVQWQCCVCNLPLYSIKYKTNPIPAGSLFHIQKHPPGKGGKEKAEETFRLLIKKKKHPGRLKCNTFRWERGAILVCVRRHCEGKMLWNCGSCHAWNKHQQSHARICLSMFVCPLTSQAKYSPAPIPAAAQPSQHGQDSRFGGLYCSSCHQQTWGCLAHPPGTTHHGICTSHHPFPRIMESQNPLHCNEPLMVTEPWNAFRCKRC